MRGLAFGILVLVAASGGVARTNDGANASGTCTNSAAEWAKFQDGRAAFSREWRRDDGFGAYQPDPHVQHVTNSCTMCHNTPKGSAGSGGNAPGYAAVGRNTPHLFGVGVLEAISDHIHDDVLAKYGSRQLGYIEKSALNGARIVVEAVPGVQIDFGRLAVTADGLLDIDPSFVIWFVDHAGRPLPMVDSAGVRRTIQSTDVAGFDFYHGFTGWAVSEHQFPTIRTFILGVWKAFFGFPFADRLAQTTAEGHVWAGRSASGRRQLAIASVADVGGIRGPDASLADALEHFLLNHPKPAQRAPTPEGRRGKELFEHLGCTACHTPAWRVSEKSDLRSMDWSVDIDRSGGFTSVRIERPVGDERLIEGIYSDFRYHDLGDRFREYAWVGDRLAVRTKFKTPPLWGVASTAPYGHDGSSLTLDAVIRRHGGEAEVSARSYATASDTDRAAVLAFLEDLTLFSLGDALLYGCGSQVETTKVQP